MAAGVAVIATRTGGAQEIVEDGATGRLVEVGDHEALASTISWLLAREDERARMAERGRERARTRFSLERMVAETEALYREVLEVDEERSAT